MRADDSQYEEYAERFAEIHGVDTADVYSDETFQTYWDHRHDSDEAMADLLAYVMDMDYDDALAWVQYEES